MGLSSSLVVQDFVHQQYVNFRWVLHVNFFPTFCVDGGCATKASNASVFLDTKKHDLHELRLIIDILYIYDSKLNADTSHLFAKGPDEKSVCSARFTELRKQTIQRLKHSKSHCSDYVICQALWWKYKRAPML